MITTELVVVGVGCILFYLRLAMIRGRRQRLKREFSLMRKKAGGKITKEMESLQAEAERTGFAVTSWPLVVLGVILMSLGVAANSAGWPTKEIAQYWWAVTLAGVGVFIFCFK